MTDSFRDLINKPNFFILGAAKAGTTTLYNQINQHSQVFLTLDKEPMFFSRDDYYEHGLDWYLKTFYTQSDGFSIRGEASPHYLYWAEKVAQRIQNHYANTPVKFIIILRNPITRAYSWYWNMVAEGQENLSFIDALKAEKSRIKENKKELEFYGSMRFGYIRGGEYVSQIRSFLRFFSRDQFLFLLQDDLKQDYRNVFEIVFRFLSISLDFNIIPHQSNPAGVPRIQGVQQILRNKSRLKDLLKRYLPYNIRQNIKTALLEANKKKLQYPPMNRDAHKFLLEYYNESLLELAEFLGRDISAWSE